MTPLRIDLVQGGLGAGGAEKIVHALAHRWSAAGHDVRVLALSDRWEAYHPYARAVPVLARTPRAGGGAAARLRDRAAALLWLRARLRARAPDVVVSFLTKVNVLSAAAAGGAALILAERNNPAAQAAHPAWRAATRLALRRADGIVMQTRAALGTLPPARRARASVIPNPCLLPALPPRDRASAPDFIGVGRLDRQKGFDLLIDAFALHAGAGGAGRLTIHGEGPERGALEAQARRLDVAARVALPGTTPAPGGWLDGAGIFVLSSRHEGFPNVLVEALGAGFPAIAADCPWGPAELLGGGGGVLVPAGDVPALAAAMSALAADPARRRALAAAAPASVAHLGAEAVMALWDAALARAAARRARRARVPGYPPAPGAPVPSGRR